MKNLSPRAIVAELDRHIVGQQEAKRAVAIALRNRWRRQQLDPTLRDEVVPKNILMIGPTGVGKTEIARRLARLAEAPFVKVEATKFTEVGYVGRDVDGIVRDLVEVAMAESRARLRRDVEAKAAEAAQDRVLDTLVGPAAQPTTRQSFRRRLAAGELDATEIEIELRDQTNPLGNMEVPGMPAQMMNLQELFGRALQRTKRRRVTVAEALREALAEEADKLLDEETVKRTALKAAEESGIVFIDEIDKVATRSDLRGADVSREGVQRDLLPLIEGTTVATKYGPVKTDHVLFIASGAFSLAKPSDLLPELQGRLPIRVELKPLGEAEFVRILTEPEANLLKQSVALLATEGVTLAFPEDGVRAIARLSADINRTVENIGARRLHTVLERILEEVSFHGPDARDATVRIDAAYVEARVGDLARNADLSRFIL